MKYSVKDLKTKLREGNSFSYECFQGGCFSLNSINNFIVDDIEYSSIYQFMVYKALLNVDKDVAGEVIKTSNIGKIQAIKVNGKSVDDYILNVSEEDLKCGLLAKFSQNEGIKSELLSTGDKVLVFTIQNKYWGIGLGLFDSNIENPFYWSGENILGFMLMSVRDDLKN